MSKAERRQSKLIKPALQLRWAMLLVLGAAFGLIAQALLLIFTWTRMAASLPQDGPEVLARLPGTLGVTLALTAVILLPLLLLLAVLATFRIVGPIHRMEEFLRSTLAGEKPGDCRLREKDHFQGLCTLLNRATREQRSEPIEGARSMEAA